MKTKTKTVKKKRLDQAVELRFVSDPRHGWIEVPAGLLRTVGYNLEDVSAWVGDTCFLEEDAEATMFFELCERHGFEVKTQDIEVDDFEAWLASHPAQWANSGRPCWWPGPTRLYDKEVECGAVLLLKEQAQALALAGMKLVNASKDRRLKDSLFSAIEVLDFTFGLGIHTKG